MNGIGDLKKKSPLEVYTTCKFTFTLLCLWGIILVQNMIVMQANLPLFTSNDLKPF